MKVTILCENTGGHRVGLGEHGFSAFIETNHGNYLFDTGRGESVVRNSLELNKDIRTIKKIFLSHGHYDHTGGLPEVLKLKGKVDARLEERWLCRRESPATRSKNSLRPNPTS